MKTGNNKELFLKGSVIKGYNNVGFIQIFGKNNLCLLNDCIWKVDKNNLGEYGKQ